MAVPTIYHGEAQLLSWSDTSNTGPKIVLALPDADALEPFKMLTMGRKAGQRFALAVVLIGEDEKPVPLASHVANGRGAVAGTKGGEIAKWLVLRGKEPAFQDFVRQAYDLRLGGNGSGWGDVSPEDFGGDVEAYTKHCVLFLCSCETSRAEIDTDPLKRQLWRDNIRDPWVALQRAMEQLPR